MTDTKSPKLHAALIIFFVFAVYYPSIFAPFTSLDDLKMVNHLLNYDDFTLKGLFLPNSSGTYYRPLLYLTFVMDKYLWGAEASFMHLENILLHIGNSLLVFFLARQLLSVVSMQSSYTPLVAALLFGMHPITTEPVNWISGRTDLLAALFVLTALLLFVRSVSEESCGYGFCAALALFAGCLSKETALFLLPVILLWTFLPPKGIPSERSLTFRAVLAGMFCSAGVGYLTLRWLALRGGDKIVKAATTMGSPVLKGPSVDVVDVARVVAKTAGFYFKKLVIPMPLNFGIDTISPHYFWLGLLVIAAVVWCLVNRNTGSYLLIASFLLTSSAFMLPILRITWTPVAERYLYIAAAPFTIGVSLFFLQYVSNWVPLRLISIFIAILLGGAAVITAKRTIIWQDNYTLYKDTMEKSPGFGAIVNEYALSLRERGQVEEADKIMLSNQVDDFQAASINKIRIMTRNGHLEEARALLLGRINKGADYKQVLLELLVTIDEGRKEKAGKGRERHAIDREILSTSEQLLALTGDPFYHYKIGRLHLELNDRAAARTSFEKAWQNAPQESYYREPARKLCERL